MESILYPVLSLMGVSIKIMRPDRIFIELALKMLPHLKDDVIELVCLACNDTMEHPV